MYDKRVQGDNVECKVEICAILKGFMRKLEICGSFKFAHAILKLCIAPLSHHSLTLYL